MGVLNCHRRTEKQTDGHYDSELASGRFSEKKEEEINLDLLVQKIIVSNLSS